MDDKKAISGSGSGGPARNLHRATRGLLFLENLVQDVVYGTRQFRRNPIVTLTAVLTLAVAIGAVTTIFTVANALLFRDPPAVADPGRLVDIGVNHKGIGFSSTSYPNYLDIVQRTRTLDGVYAHPRFPQAMSLTNAGGISDALERVDVTEVSANYFRVLGAVPAAGRLFDVGASASEASTAVLSYRFWTRRFNRASGIIGQTLRLNGDAFTVIGIAAEGFQGTGVRATDIWRPLRTTNTNRAGAWLLVGGRLKPGASMAQAAAEVAVIGRSLQQEYPVENKDKGLSVSALSPVPGETRPVGGFLALLLAIVAVVLAIACANVSGVLLARAAARGQEIAVRAAIGAGRARIFRQLLTETVLLFAWSAVAGLVLARVMTSIIVSRLPALPFPVELSLSLDTRVVVFTMALSFCAALLSGLAPALQSSRGEMVSALKNDSQSGFGRLRLRNAFVVVQVALSLLLIVVAGLFVRALQTVSSIDPGFDAKGVELVSVDLLTAGYTDAAAPAFSRQLLDRVRRLPRVEAATIAAVLPGGFEGIGLGGIWVAGVSPPDGAPLFSPTWNIVEPGYFATLHMPLLAGRDFSEEDRSTSQAVVIIGEGAARKFWSAENAVGKYIELRSWGPAGQLSESKSLLVVGVARDPKFGSLVDGTTGVYAYVPLQQQYMRGAATMIAARATDGRRLTEEIRSTVASANPNLLIESAQTGEEYASLGLVPWRVAASVSGSLGIVGLLLAGIGIYGVTAYMVTRRTREIGIRVALGAKRMEVVGMILRQSMSLVAVGAAIGLTLAAAAGRLLVSILFGIPPLDPVIFSGAAVLFVLVGLAACCVPLLRAARINAMEALRHD